MSNNFEKLRELYAVIDGIPAALIGLRHWREVMTPDGYKIINEGGNELFMKGLKTKPATEHQCGTVGCAMGFACAYPPFVEEGLWFKDCPRFGGVTSFNAAAAFFDITYQEAMILFIERRERLYLDDYGLADKVRANEDRWDSDKATVLARIRNFLLIKGAITPTRHAELARLPVT